jgi:hypothetical protein
MAVYTGFALATQEDDTGREFSFHKGKHKCVSIFDRKT